MVAGTATGQLLIAAAAGIEYVEEFYPALDAKLLQIKAKLAEDENFYGAKIITARFYAEQVMPRVIAYVQAAESGSDMTMALADDQF